MSSAPAAYRSRASRLVVLSVASSQQLAALLALSIVRLLLVMVVRLGCFFRLRPHRFRSFSCGAAAEFEDNRLCGGLAGIGHGVNHGIVPRQLASFGVDRRLWLVLVLHGHICVIERDSEKIRQMRVLRILCAR